MLRSIGQTCPSCCLDCCYGQQPVQQDLDSSADPYSLLKLLPAGTIHLPLSQPAFTCDHYHTEDGWHAFRGQALLQYVASIEHDSILRELDFLMKHSFISCTCRLGKLGDVLHVRIYIIPHDLLNVQGRLRVRDETTVLAPARRYLSVLLPKIIQDASCWKGTSDSWSGAHKQFLRQDIVCISH